MEFNEALLAELRLLREAVEQVADTLEEISDQLNDMVMEEIYVVGDDEDFDDVEDFDDEDLDEDDDFEEDDLEVDAA